MSKLKVAVIMGSDSDLPLMQEGVKILKDFGVPVEVKILSAHRSPDLAAEFVSGAKANGFGVIIAGAGGAAHLAGVTAAHTILPVIGVPVNATPLNGFDSLLSTVQMPAGIPVATVAVGSAGPKNAALLAIQILALSDDELSTKLIAHKKRMADQIVEKNKNLKV